AARARATSEKSRNRRSGAQAASSSAGYCPVATTTATAPQARAQSTSWGVSPMMVTRSKSKSWPTRRPARSRAMLGRHRRSMWSEPNAPTRKCSRSPVGRSLSRAPASMLPVRRPTTASGRALSAGTPARCDVGERLRADVYRARGGAASEGEAEGAFERVAVAADRAEDVRRLARERAARRAGRGRDASEIQLEQDAVRLHAGHHE